MTSHHTQISDTSLPASAPLNFAAIANEITAYIEVEEETDSVAITHQRWALEDAILRTTPQTLDDVSEILTMVIKAQEIDAACPLARTALRTSAHALIALGHSGRIKAVYFNHVDFAPYASAAAPMLAHVRQVTTQETQS